ncbi:alpha-2-macroglobulin receptor-associated protein-like [Dreissena polymorpha]|uniref:alpha-2-macroglobulin receptor-associated protein-like n=1 Tax=Dreissena polymorpha TaxID=45954 RepID=UPI00226494BB|nr:alpha-2-macroglobulin receptor-associated protein-like [Dreissena polymorpha]
MVFEMLTMCIKPMSFLNLLRRTIHTTMNTTWKFATIFQIYFLVSVLCTDLKKENPFRMSKVNAVWHKGQKVLKEKRLSDLYADLQVQDRREVDLKLRKTEGVDNEGLFEAQVRKEMAVILDRYGLTRHFPGENYSGSPGYQPNENGSLPLNIRDNRLKDLLNKAQIEGFSDAEMSLLHEEMHHHQEKMDEYEQLRAEYEQLEGKIDNSVENIDDQTDTYARMSDVKKEMKAKHKEVQESLKTTEDRVKNPGVHEIFQDPRVYHLWALAQKAEMDENELSSIKTELEHFERRIKKAEYMSGKVRSLEEKLQSGQDVNPADQASWREKADFQNRKVEKYHNDLKLRIQRKFDEL